MTTEYEMVADEGLVTPQTIPWSEELARSIAMTEGLGELTEAHWQVIHTLREHFVLYGALPPKQLACGLNHMAPHCVEELFQGPTEAWRVAGLPEPGSEAVA